MNRKKIETILLKNKVCTIISHNPLLDEDWDQISIKDKRILMDPIFGSVCSNPLINSVDRMIIQKVFNNIENHEALPDRNRIRKIYADQGIDIDSVIESRTTRRPMVSKIEKPKEIVIDSSETLFREMQGLDHGESN